MCIISQLKHSHICMYSPPTPTPYTRASTSFFFSKITSQYLYQQHVHIYTSVETLTHLHVFTPHPHPVHKSQHKFLLQQNNITIFIPAACAYIYLSRNTHTHLHTHTLDGGRVRGGWEWGKRTSHDHKNKGQAWDRIWTAEPDHEAH